MLQNEEYRYTTLAGFATVTRTGEGIEVNLHDSGVNPRKETLLFDDPLKSDSDANPEDGQTVEIAIKITAGLDEDCYEEYNRDYGLHFRKKDGQLVNRWQDLDQAEQGKEMDPVKPKVGAEAVPSK